MSHINSAHMKKYRTVLIPDSSLLPLNICDYLILLKFVSQNTSTLLALNTSVSCQLSVFPEMSPIVIRLYSDITSLFPSPYSSSSARPISNAAYLQLLVSFLLCNIIKHKACASGLPFSLLFCQNNIPHT